MTNVIKDPKCNSWSQINWAKANRIVNNLQRRIFVAKQHGRFRTVRKLQNLLLSAESNKQLAVRQVCQNNMGRKTSGIDKKVFLKPSQRWKLVQQLSKTNLKKWKPTPTKRIYISKSNGQLRPLGIPTLTDRALQATIKNALEPEWEALFEPSSYGFRKGRSAHDAIRYIHSVCNSRSTKTWIVDADIKGCFDNISHEFLNSQLKSFPARQLINRWLKAGYVEKNVFHDSPMGTPQGGVISPLLANIALHGMEECLSIQRHKNGRIKSPYTLIRYADDFIVACRSKKDAEQAQSKINIWLQSRGLSLSNTKTHITHISKGFEFLGFNIRLYTSTHKNALLIKPSQLSRKKLRYNLKTTWKSLLSKPVKTVISKLNPIIKGWANYFKIGVSSKIFSSLDHYMWIRAYQYARRTHNKKAWKWIKKKYWGPLCPNRKDQWVFGDKNTGDHMYKFSWTPIKRHIMVKGHFSPYDPALQEYWKTRATNETSTLRTASNTKMAKRQNCLCPVCSNPLYSTGEPVVVHHLIHQSKSGKNEYKNLMLLHNECHKKVHSLNWTPDILKHRLKVLTGK